jgi:hypothetical protein
MQNQNRKDGPPAQAWDPTLDFWRVTPLDAYSGSDK